LFCISFILSFHIKCFISYFAFLTWIKSIIYIILIFILLFNFNFLFWYFWLFRWYYFFLKELINAGLWCSFSFRTNPNFIIWIIPTTLTFKLITGDIFRIYLLFSWLWTRTICFLILSFWCFFRWRILLWFIFTNFFSYACWCGQWILYLVFDAIEMYTYSLFIFIDWITTRRYR